MNSKFLTGSDLEVVVVDAVVVVVVIVVVVIVVAVIVVAVIVVVTQSNVFVFELREEESPNIFSAFKA